MDLDGLPRQGSHNAKVAIVEFSDYECPFCARHVAVVGKELQKEFVATGKVQHFFANNPLPIHKNAVLLATAAICAGDQGKYWQMHDFIFDNKPNTVEGVTSLAHSLLLDSRAFDVCLADNPRLSDLINKDKEEANRLGLRGTPGFALGLINSEGHMHVQKLISGSQSLDVFQSVITELLSEL